MDKRPIILIVVNIIMTVLIAVLAYFSYGFRGFQYQFNSGDDELPNEGIYINGVELDTIEQIPNVENCLIVFNSTYSMQIIINTKAKISYVQNGEFKSSSDLDVKKLLSLNEENAGICLDTSKRTLTQMFKTKYNEGQISEIIETTEDWIFALNFKYMGKEILLKLYDVGVDIGPSDVVLDKEVIVL